MTSAQKVLKVQVVKERRLLAHHGARLIGGDSDAAERSEAVAVEHAAAVTGAAVRRGPVAQVKVRRCYRGAGGVVGVGTDRAPATHLAKWIHMVLDVGARMFAGIH